MVYHDLPDPTNSALPKALQCGQIFETNLSPQSCTFTVHKHARFSPRDMACMLTGTPFRLYHSQSESFVHASCNPDKVGMVPPLLAFPGLLGSVP